MAPEPGLWEVRFPRWLGPARDDGARPRPAPAGGTEAVLLVDDDPAIREVSRRALHGAGYRAVAARSGAEALSMLEGMAEPPALLVTDRVMPGMSGRELAARACERHPRLRVLFVSGYSQDAGLPDAAPGDGLEPLPKPFTPSLLLARIRAILDRA